MICRCIFVSDFLRGIYSPHVLCLILAPDKMKTYVVGTHQKCLHDVHVFLRSTTTYFPGEIRKLPVLFVETVPYLDLCSNHSS